MPKRLFRVYFHTWKIRVKGVFWKSFYEDDIQPEIQVRPPPPDYSKRLFFKKKSFQKVIIPKFAILY